MMVPLIWSLDLQVVWADIVLYEHDHNWLMVVVVELELEFSNRIAHWSDRDESRIQYLEPVWYHKQFQLCRYLLMSIDRYLAYVLK